MTSSLCLLRSINSLLRSSASRSLVCLRSSSASCCCCCRCACRSAALSFNSLCSLLCCTVPQASTSRSSARGYATNPASAAAAVRRASWTDVGSGATMSTGGGAPGPLALLLLPPAFWVPLAPAPFPAPLPTAAPAFAEDDNLVLLDRNARPLPLVGVRDDRRAMAVGGGGARVAAGTRRRFRFLPNFFLGPPPWPPPMLAGMAGGSGMMVQIDTGQRHGKARNVNGSR
mmetsp:Transcript_29453/g.85717  ORF Transcript_29453/g.85717 Transcript_29453/m.85717 type:complete len:229 (-) Transcript_29453:210-896(-)